MANCVYKITNIQNGKQYVGITCRNIKIRFKEHIESALYDKTKNTHLYNAIKVYGKNSFVIELVEEVDTVEELSTREQFWIKQLNTLCPNGYNYLLGGLYNYKLSEDHILKLSTPIKAISTIDNSEFYFISAARVPSNFGKASISCKADTNIEYKGYYWYRISKEQYLSSSRNDNIKSIPYMVAISKDETIFMNRGDTVKYGFEPGTVGRILRKEYGRKSHKGFTFMYYKDYIVSGMPTSPGGQQ